MFLNYSKHRLEGEQTTVGCENKRTGVYVICLRVLRHERLVL